MKMKYLINIALIASLLSSSVFAQSNDESVIKSKGPIPSTLTVSTTNLIKEEVSKLSKRRDHKIITNNVFQINQLLHEGKIVFGSYSNQIIQDIFDRIVEISEDDKIEDIEFFIIKSPRINAFSTHQGVICITTGLLSNIQNEAQLAYVMCHEIIHFLESHTLIKHHFRSKNNKFKEEKERAKSYSTFSKKQEFIADLKGFDIYKNLGYSINEAANALDVLRQLGSERTNLSDIPLNIELFNSESYEIPADKFNTFEKEEIIIEKDSSSVYRSHPEIESRIQKIKDEIAKENITDSGKKFIVSTSDDFKKMNNQMLLDDISNNINNLQFEKAIYLYEISKTKSDIHEILKTKIAKSLYAHSKKRLLEIPKSKFSDLEKKDEHIRQFLERVKFNKGNERWVNGKPNPKILKREHFKFKGDITPLNDFLNWNTTSLELSCLALNALLTCEDEDLDIYIEDIIYDLVKIHQIDTSFFNKERVDYQVSNTPEATKKDTVVTKKDNSGLTLLEKLNRNKQEIQEAEEERNDNAPYIKNAIVGFWDNPIVRSSFKHAKNIYIKEDDEKEDNKSKDEDQLNIDKIIVLEADNYVFDDMGHLKINKTASLRDKLDKCLLSELKRHDIEVVNYDPNALEESDVDLWNESALVNQFLEEYYSFNQYGIIPLSDISSVYEKHETPYVLISSEISEQYYVDFRSRFYQVLSIPFTPFFGMRLLNRPSVNTYNAIVIDMKEMKMVYQKDIRNVFGEQEIHKLIKINRMCKDIKNL